MVINDIHLNIYIITTIASKKLRFSRQSHCERIVCWDLDVGEDGMSSIIMFIMNDEIDFFMMGKQLNCSER